MPFPGSLIFWGCLPYLKLHRELPLAMQLPLLSVCDRCEALQGLRIPQCGWMHEPHPGLPEPDLQKGKLRNTYRRTHRWARIARHENELSVAGREDRLAHVLFSSEPADVGLYGKPMARNSQIWTYHYELLLDGPLAGRRELSRAAAALRAGGQFGYRFHFPPMQAGDYDVFWQRPLTAFWDPKAKEARVLEDAPAGYFTAYRSEKPDLARPVELWPQFQHRPEYAALAEGYRRAYAHENHQFALNAHKLIEVCECSRPAVPAARFRPADSAHPQGADVAAVARRGRQVESPRRIRFLVGRDAAADHFSPRRSRRCSRCPSRSPTTAPPPARLKSPIGRRSRNCPPGVF